MAGTAPSMPCNRTTINTSSAREGIVWIMPAAPRIACPRVGPRAAQMPKGTAATIAANNDALTKTRC
jgi:hypothetical protein